tara:strand:- start:563 stop:1084 length:522 start_codon:yes stop_codon:yes gene_type:complete
MDIYKDLYIEFSSIDYDSCKQPFFIKNVESKGIDNSDNIFCNLKLENIPDFLLTFYKSINTIDREFYINNWTFISFNKIIEINTNYLKNNIQAIDIAFTYMGMGHIQIAFYDPKTNLIMIRWDGGSSGIDREYNYNLLKQYYNETNNSIGTQETFSSFDELLIYIKNYKNNYL